jgi:signal transduction histidine kinase
MQSSTELALSASQAANNELWYGVIDDDRAMSNGPSDRTLAELRHDLRQPLTTLKMNLQAILHLLRRPRPRIGAALDAVVDCLAAEQELIVLLATMTRSATYKLAATTRVALNVVVTDVHETLSQAKPDLAKRVAVHLADHSPIVNGDAPSLRFALLSLVRHALESRDADRVVIGTRQLDGRAELRVSGIPLLMVVGPSVHSTLAVTQSVVQAHRGLASIDQRPSGATVRIVLPALSDGRMSTEVHHDK